MRAVKSVRFPVAFFAVLLGTTMMGHASSEVRGQSAKARMIQISSPGSFDWFGNAQNADKARAARSSLTSVHSGRKLGQGSWICSPAGFGRKSSCIAR